MAKKSLTAAAGEGKQASRRSFLAGIGAALAVAAVPAVATAASTSSPAYRLTDSERIEIRWMCDYIEYLMQPEFDLEGVLVRRAMSYGEVAEYIALKSPGEKVAFLDAMGAIDSATL